MRTQTKDLVANLVAQLHLTAAAIRADTADVSNSDHVAIIKHFDEVRLASASIKEAREVISEIEETLSRVTIPDVMRLVNVKTTTIEGVGRVTVSYRYSCSMLDKEQGMLWLKANNHGGLIQETVNASTLAAFSKNLLETEGLELPPELFKVGTSPYTSITKV
jgi:hypothetical protein